MLANAATWGGVSVDPLRSMFVCLALFGLCAALLPTPAAAIIDPETYPFCSTSSTTASPCTGAAGGGPSPTILCWSQPPQPSGQAGPPPENSNFWGWPAATPPPTPQSAGWSQSCLNNPNPASPKCPGGPSGYWGECIPIELPGQIMASTAFWDDQGNGDPTDDSAYLLGGMINLGGSESADITRFTRGMEVLPFPPVVPHAPGGTINGLQFPPPGGLPAARGNQALAWDPVARTAYLFGGTAGGAGTDEIVAYTPDTSTAVVLPTALPGPYDMMAGTWNPTPTPTCPAGCAYLFGGRTVLEQTAPPYNIACTHKSDLIWLYEPISGQVLPNPWKLPRPVYGMTAVTVGSSIYLFGGANMPDNIVGQQEGEPNEQIDTCDPTGLTGMPAPTPNGDIYRYDILQGGTITRMNPYLRPDQGGPAWGTGSFSTSLALNIRPGVVYDGKYIFIFRASTWRIEPGALAPGASWFPQSVSSTGMGPARGGFGNMPAVYTGCSAYTFGGFINPLVSPPDGPLSDKIGWFGKCRGKAIIDPSFEYSCTKWPILFDARNSVPGEADFMYVTWNFGDGTPSKGGFWSDFSAPDAPGFPTVVPKQLIQHTYTKVGAFTVTLRITDMSGFQIDAPPVIIKVKEDSTCKAYTGTEPLGYNQMQDKQFVPAPQDVDSDQDGVPDVSDNCPGVANHEQADWDTNLVGDACEEAPAEGEVTDDQVIVPSGKPIVDGDHDGIADGDDNCPLGANHDQSDVDGDAAGDVCDPDMDGDGVPNDGRDGAFLDNCPRYPNQDQRDGNGDGIGDDCTFGAAPAPPRVEGVANPPADDAAPESMTGTVVMVVAGALMTAGILALVLRRGLRRE